MRGNITVLLKYITRCEDLFNGVILFFNQFLLKILFILRARVRIKGKGGDWGKREFRKLFLLFYYAPPPPSLTFK